MAETVTYVSAGKPAEGGAIYRAPLGTALPKTATESLNAAFVGLGYCSDDGLTNSNTAESEDVNAWGGDPVLNIQTSKPDNFTVNLLEVLNPDVLKAVYGDDNVTGTLETGITVNANSDEPQEAAWVVDMVMRGGALKRIVLPDAKISEVGDIVYKDDEAARYELTLKAMPDTAGQTHYEYIKKAPNGATGATS